MTAEAAYRARPWRIHAIARDFRLEDLWDFDLAGRTPDDIRPFLACFWSIFHVLERSVLARTRLRVGEALGWDDHDFTLPIPGCKELSLAERLDDDDRKNNLADPKAPSPIATPKLKTVYIFAKEAAFEFSNDTIHGFLHVAIGGDVATLAVYVKHRGLFSRAYMASIWPARHLVLYPALIRKLEAEWVATKP